MRSECKSRKVCILFKGAHGTDNVYCVLHVIHSLTLKAFYKRNKMHLQQLFFIAINNRPPPSSKIRHFQNEANCHPFFWKWVLFAWEWRLHIKGWALNLVLIQSPPGNSEMVYCHMIWALLYLRCIKDQSRLQFSSQYSCDSFTSEPFTMLLRQFLSTYFSCPPHTLEIKFLINKLYVDSHCNFQNISLASVTVES